MGIPKKKYRDKVRQRLVVVQALFADRSRVEEMMRRVHGYGGFEKGSDFHNKMEAISMLLNIDVPVLLDALDELTVIPVRRVGEDTLTQVDFPPEEG